MKGFKHLTFLPIYIFTTRDHVYIHNNGGLSSYQVTGSSSVMNDLFNGSAPAFEIPASRRLYPIRDASIRRHMLSIVTGHGSNVQQTRI